MLLSIHVGVTDGLPPPIRIGTVAKARPMKMPSRTTRRSRRGSRSDCQRRLSGTLKQMQPPAIRFSSTIHRNPRGGGKSAPARSKASQAIEKASASQKANLVLDPRFRPRVVTGGLRTGNDTAEAAVTPDQRLDARLPIGRLACRAINMQQQYGLVVPVYDLPAQCLEFDRLALDDDR